MTSSPNPARDEAAKQVGLWLYYFAQLEKALNDALQRTLELTSITRDLLSAVDIAKKVSILKGAAQEAYGAGSPEQKEAEKYIDAVFEHNMVRIIVAHQPFEPHEDGVVFNKPGKKPEVWTAQKFLDAYAKLQSATSNIQKLLTVLKPFNHSLDLSDPRNSMYAAVIS